MTYHNTEFPKIGETTEHAAPALRRSLTEIVAEYDEKAAAIPEVIAEFNRAEAAVNVAASIGGAYGGQVFSRSPSLYERDVRLDLLRSAWKHVYEGLQIERIASAKDRKQLDLKLTNPPPC